ncbi:mg2+ transporter, partial [Phlyctema vagabunda]
QLTSRFWPLDSTQSFDDRYSLFNEGSLVDSSNWADIISQKHPRLNLIIRRKKNQSYTEPRRRGSFSASDSETERAEQDSELPSSFASAVASFIAIQDRPFRARGSSSERRKSLFDDVAINAPSASPYISATVINEVQTTLKEFHYFLWINAVPVQLEDQNSKSLGSSRPPRMFNVRMDELAKMFGSMQSFLDKSSSIKRSAFRACPSESFNLVQTYLDEIRRYGEELKRRDEEVRRREEQVRRLNEEAKRKEEEERRQVEELRRRKEEARRREEKRKAESRESSELQSRTRSRSRPRSSRSLPRSPDDMRVTRHVSHRRSDYTEPEIIELPRAERVYVETEYVRRPQYGPSPRKVARMKRAFCNTMLKCFTFYFPVNFKSHLIDKYWGAMFSLLKQNDRDFLDFYRIFDVSYSRILGRIEDLLDKLARALSDGKGPLPWDISLPKEFGNAWLHLLSFIVLCAVDTKKIDDDNTRKELSRFDELFRKGLKLLARNLGVQFLSGKQAVLPFGLVSVITATLLRDVTSGQPDISSTYYDYMKNLEQEIQINPYNRSHQEKIAYLRQEIDVVLKVLAEQLQCVSALQAGPRQELLEAPDKVREFYILQDCLALIKAKTQSFQEMEMVATQLGIYNIRRIESNKDRQEAAILVFTIVTIIFLPLSFVSSFFGMNTVDIRDMGSSQWLFWAVGIPVTVIVVGLSLVFAHKIEPTREWWGRVKNRFSSAKIQPVFIEKQTLDDMYRTNSIVAGAGAAAAAAAAPYSRIVEPMGGRTVLEDDLYAARSRVMREMERDNEFSGPTRHLEREGMPYAMRYPELPRRRQPYGPGPLRRPSPPPGYSRPPPPPPPPLVRVPRSPSRFR